MVAPWWQRDPDLLAVELRSLRGAGFRVVTREVIEQTLLVIRLERQGNLYQLVYPINFPSGGAIAMHGHVIAGASEARAFAPLAQPGGSGVLALDALIHERKSSFSFAPRRFGVLLAGPWQEIDDGDGGILSACTSGRGSAVLVADISGTRRAGAISLASMSLIDAFDGGAIGGWWARSAEPSWDQGLAGIAEQVEQAIGRRHKITNKQVWSNARPLLGLAWPSRLPGVTGWMFISRGPGGGRVLGVNEFVRPESFAVRAPYADGLNTKRVAIIGCGSLGWPIAIGLARAGVRSFTLFDADRLYPGNLARLGAEVAQTAEHKVDALRAALLQVASAISVDARAAFVGDLIDAHAIVQARPDLIIDAAADEATPTPTNAAALALRVPAIYCWMTRGVRSARIFRIIPGATACYACVAFARPRSLVDEPRSEAHEFTWIGANFNIDPIAAAGVRMAVRTLAADPVDDTNPDHFILRVGGVVPIAETLAFRRNPSCPWCRGVRT